MMTSGEKLAKLRKENNYTQEQLAELMGVSRQAVSKWESGLAYPETEKLIRLGKLYHCSLDYLLNEETNEATPGRQPACRPELFSYERKSARLIRGVPLWHINLGYGRTAKGIIAIGYTAKGILSVGLLSMGVLSFGVLSLGLISLGVVALGLLAFGSMAVGILAVGALCFGVVAIGSLTVGQFSAGALAIAQYAAIGDNARGMVAIGKSEAAGSIFQKIGMLSPMEREQVIALLDSAVPTWLSWAAGIWKIFL